MKIEEGLNVGAMRETAFPFHPLEFLGLIVAPSALREKSVENEDLLVVRSAAMLEAPLEEFLIRHSGENSLDDRGILDAQKTANAHIGAGPMLVIRRQFSLCIQTNLVEHSPEEDEPTNLLGRMSEAWDFHCGHNLSQNLKKRQRTGAVQHLVEFGRGFLKQASRGARALGAFFPGRSQGVVDSTVQIRVFTIGFGAT